MNQLGSQVRLFETSDLLLAAVLQSHGFPVLRTDWREPKRCTFFFESVIELDDLVDMFWKQKLRIEPHQLFDSIKALKARIFSS